MDHVFTYRIFNYFYLNVFFQITLLKKMEEAFILKVLKSLYYKKALLRIILRRLVEV